MSYSQTSARVSSGFQTRENIWNHSACGLVVLLFSSVWKPDETLALVCEITITIVLDFSWEDCCVYTQDKLETIIMQNFGG